MSNKNNNGMSHEVVATYFGISESEITNIVIKYVRRAIKEQDEIGCTEITETFAAGAEKYRITISGAYNDLQNGGTKKTDYCFAKISFEIKGFNGRFMPIGDNWVKENGISHGTYADAIYNAIFDYFAHDLVIKASYDGYAKEIVALAEQKYIAEQEEKVQDTIAEYQQEVNGYVEDLKWFDYNDFENKMEVYSAMVILKKIKEVSDNCLKAIGEINGCEMVWDDGYHIDLTEIGKWSCGVTCDDFAIYDLEDLISDLAYMTEMEYDLPLADEDTLKEVENCGEVLWWGICFPSYVQEEVNGYVTTYYHYAYCA
jgi:hypothetical protein